MRSIFELLINMIALVLCIMSQSLCQMSGSSGQLNPASTDEMRSHTAYVSKRARQGYRAVTAYGEALDESNQSTQIFTCFGLNLNDESFQIKLSNWSVGGDRMGPVARYQVSGGGAFAQAMGDVRLSNRTYQFLNGKLGELNAILVPSNQGFWTFVVGSKGSQCSNQDTA